MYENIISNDSEDAYRDYRIKVHAMKNSAAMCGALSVSSLARVLEFAAKDLDRTTLTSVMPVFEKEWIKLKGLIDNAFKNNDYDRPAIDRTLFEQYLNSLKSAMEELDTDTADAIIEEFANYGFEENEQKIVNELAIAVKNLDSNATTELIAKLR